jgi:hypothetical protein
LSDDPHYHDGYDTDLSFHLDTDNTLLGPHCEGSVQEALWAIFKSGAATFEDGVWKALSRSGKEPKTIFDFYQNWKDLGLPGLDNVVAIYKKFKMEFGYRYLDGAQRFTAVAAPKKFDAAKHEFQTVKELFDQFGSMGSGTFDQFKEEFYNRNRSFNKGSLASGSKISDPKVKAGTAYIVPERFQVKA